MNLNYERVLHPMLHDVGLHSCDSSWRRSSAIWTRWRSTRRRAGESIPGKAAPRRTDAWPPVGAAGTRSGGRAGAQGGGARTRSGSVFCGGGGESLELLLDRLGRTTEARGFSQICRRCCAWGAIRKTMMRAGGRVNAKRTALAGQPSDGEYVV
jgi:hypothetical protein